MSGRRRRDLESVVRAAEVTDRDALRAALTDSWGSLVMVVHDEQINVLELPALLAVNEANDLLGVVTFRDRGDSCEVITLNAFAGGIGTALLEAIFERARACGLARVWLMTTNDNIDAIRFYQRRGMRLVRVDAGAVDRARVLKSEIPLVGEYGIALHDELEFEIVLESEDMPQSA